MTKYEKFVVSAYTGVYMGRRDEYFEFLNFAAMKLGKTEIYTHEIPKVKAELKEAVRQEFLIICYS